MISKVRDRGKEKIVGGELTVGDVCAACNNGSLTWTIMARPCLTAISPILLNRVN